MKKALLMATAMTLSLGFGAATALAGTEPQGVNCSLAGQEGSPGQLAKALGQNGVGGVVHNTDNTIPGQEANAVNVFCEIQNGHGGNDTTKDFEDRPYMHVGIGTAD